ncbi:MAG: sulfatase [Solirubrobacterales bacterium]|nr:sulfatase [Solirubrobacterales bacterium]
MTVARRLAPVAAAVALTLAALAGAAAAHAQDQRPNVVVLMTDDQTVDDLAAMPATRRAFVRHGVRFADSTVSYPVCCPSRASFLTGRYAHNHGVMGLYLPTGGYARFNDLDALPVWLQRVGYRTVHLGKYMNGYGSDRPAIVPPGWSEWYTAVDPTTYRMWNYTLNVNGELITYGGPGEEPERLYQTDVLRDFALDAIRRAAGDPQPLFMTLSFLAPHHEEGPVRARTGVTVRPAPRHRGRFATAALPRPRGFGERNRSDKPKFMRRFAPLDAAAIARMTAEYRARQESLLAVDEAVDAIVRELEATGQLESTYLLFTSDNGYMLGEHGVSNGKMLPYDPSARVPLLLRGPGIPARRTVREPVSNVDLAPTILELSGASAAGGLPIDGRSFMRFARQPRRRSARMVLHETGGLRATSLQPEDDTGAVPVRNVRTYRAVRDDHWLYVVYRSGERELYDLWRDPYQLRSRHRDRRYAPTKRALHAELQRLSTCRGRPCRLGPTTEIPDPFDGRFEPETARRPTPGAPRRR